MWVRSVAGEGQCQLPRRKGALASGSWDRNPQERATMAAEAALALAYVAPGLPGSGFAVNGNVLLTLDLQGRVVTNNVDGVAASPTVLRQRSSRSG